MQFAFFSLFWAALTLSTFVCTEPRYSLYTSIAVLVTLMLWMWARRSYNEITHMLKKPIIFMFVFGCLLSRNFNYYLIMVPAMLIYLKVEGGYRDEQQT